nr:hypothetical protein [Tanacetum cinerariifolium]
MQVAQVIELTLSQSEDEDDNDDDGDNDDDDDSDDERTESNSDEIADLNLTNIYQTEYEEEDVNESVSTPSDDTEMTDEEKLNDEETMDDEKDNEVNKELYEDVNVNLGNDGAEITDSNQGGSEQQNVSQELGFEVVQLQTNKLREEAQAENQEFINQVDSTMKTIIKDQVKAQVFEPNIEKYVTETLGAEVLVRTNNQPQTAYVVATSLSEFKLKKILIDKIEANKLINRSDTQKNLYNALVESYNSDKDIITSYGDVVLLKRGRDDQDKDENPSAGSDRWTKRRKSGKDVESSKDSWSKEKKSLSTSKDAFQSQHKSFGKSVYTEEPSHNVEESGMQQDQEFFMRDNDEQPVDKEVTKADRFKKLKRPPTPVLIGSPMVVNYDQHAYFGTSHWGSQTPKLLRICNNLTSSKDVYSIRRIIAVTILTIMKKYDYGHLEEIEVRRDDQQLYKFKEGYFKRLRLQDIKDMLLLLVQEKLTNLTIDERYDLNVALRMFTRHIVIQKRVEDLQLGVKSYQKKLYLTKPNTYRSNLKNKTTYTSHSDPHGIIYVDQFKRKRLLRTDELYKFSDGTLTDVQTAVYDIAAKIRMD